MKIEQIMDMLVESAENLLCNQPDILERTNQTGMTEWNLAHHYSNEVSKFLHWLDNDNDIIKSNCHNRRPDIIFHKRKSNDFNLLVIEMKISDVINDNDKVKVQQNWLQGDLSYKFGACISFYIHGGYKIWVKSGETNKELIFEQ